MGRRDWIGAWLLLAALASGDVPGPKAARAAAAAATYGPTAAPTSAPTAPALPASAADDDDEGGRWWIWIVLGVGIVLLAVAVPIAFGFVDPLRCTREDDKSAKQRPYLRRRNSHTRRSRRSRGNMSRQSSTGQLLAELNPFGSSAPPPASAQGRGSSSRELLADLEQGGRGRPQRTLSNSIIDIGMSGRTITVDTGTHVIAISPSKASGKVAPSTVYFGSPKRTEKSKNIEVKWELEDVQGLDDITSTPKTHADGARDAEPA